MSSTLGNKLKITVFGQSHGKAIGITISGLPAGIKIDMDKLMSFMERRKPGNSKISTSRKENDEPEFLSGLVGNVTCGAPLTAVIYNKDMRSGDYKLFENAPRPGHGDFTSFVKYSGFNDSRGGGHLSGRLTAPMVIAGGICKQILEKSDIRIVSRVKTIGGIENTSFDEGGISEELKDLILVTKENGDSLGGVVSTTISGVPAGVGEPIFDGIENRIAAGIFGIPGIKAIEFGSGFHGATIKGSENNDQFKIVNNKIVTETNNCGGILGGISTGMNITFNVAVKPTPTIGRFQKTVDLKSMEQVEIYGKGRHDPCIVPRILPVVEAISAVVIYDILLEEGAI